MDGHEILQDEVDKAGKRLEQYMREEGKRCVERDKIIQRLFQLNRLGRLAIEDITEKK